MSDNQMADQGQLQMLGKVDRGKEVLDDKRKPPEFLKQKTYYFHISEQHHQIWKHIYSNTGKLLSL